MPPQVGDRERVRERERVRVREREREREKEKGRESESAKESERECERERERVRERVYYLRPFQIMCSRICVTCLRFAQLLCVCMCEWERGRL